MTKAFVTVAEMARMVGMSRSRFYQLIGTAFPHPERQANTDRPIYTEKQQSECLNVKKRNYGIDGKPILFYAPRTNKPKKNISKKNAAKNEDTNLEVVKKIETNWKQQMFDEAFPNAYQLETPEQLLLKQKHKEKRLQVQKEFENIKAFGIENVIPTHTKSCQYNVLKKIYECKKDALEHPEKYLSRFIRKIEIEEFDKYFPNWKPDLNAEENLRFEIKQREDQQKQKEQLWINWAIMQNNIEWNAVNEKYPWFPGKTYFRNFSTHKFGSTDNCIKFNVTCQKCKKNIGQFCEYELVKFESPNDINCYDCKLEIAKQEKIIKDKKEREEEIQRFVQILKESKKKNPKVAIQYVFGLDFIHLYSYYKDKMILDFFCPIQIERRDDDTDEDLLKNLVVPICKQVHVDIIMIGNDRGLSNLVDKTILPNSNVYRLKSRVSWHLEEV